MIKFFLLFLLPLSVFAHEWETVPDWSTQDTYRQLAVTSALYLDYAQTKDTQRYGHHTWERNPILGSHPSDGRIRGYFITSAIAHAVISKSLPKGWPRQAWQYSVLTLEVLTVVKNKRVGFKFQF